MQLEGIVFANKAANGAVHMAGDSFLSILDSTIQANESFSCTLLLGEAVIRRSSINANVADPNSDANVCIVADVLLENSTISANTGAPIGLLAPDSVLQLESSTVVDDIIPINGGIVTTRNSVVLGCPDAGLTFLSLGYNLLHSDCTVIGITFSNKTVSTVADAGLESLTSAILPLMPGSPAIDTGDPQCLDSDQRRVTRPQDGDLDGSALCDSGAYELDPDGPDIVNLNIPTVNPLGLVLFALAVLSAGVLVLGRGGPTV